MMKGDSEHEDWRRKQQLRYDGQWRFEGMQLANYRWNRGFRTGRKNLLYFVGLDKERSGEAWELRSNLNQLKFHESGGECYKITYAGGSVVTKAEYEAFVKKYTEEIQNCWSYGGALCVELNDLLKHLGRAI